jgi:hypothetical protein
MTTRQANREKLGWVECDYDTFYLFSLPSLEGRYGHQMRHEGAWAKPANRITRKTHISYVPIRRVTISWMTAICPNFHDFSGKEKKPAGLYPPFLPSATTKNRWNTSFILREVHHHIHAFSPDANKRPAICVNTTRLTNTN